MKAQLNLVALLAAAPAAAVGPAQFAHTSFYEGHTAYDGVVPPAQSHASPLLEARDEVETGLRELREQAKGEGPFFMAFGRRLDELEAKMGLPDATLADMRLHKAALERAREDLAAYRARGQRVQHARRAAAPARRASPARAVVAPSVPTLDFVAAAARPASAVGGGSSFFDGYRSVGNSFADVFSFRGSRGSFLAGGWSQPAAAFSFAPAASPAAGQTNSLRRSPPPPPPSSASRLEAVRQRLLREGRDPRVVDTAIAIGRREGVDPILVFSVIHQESTWRPGECSGAGACGLMGVKRDTARDMGVRGNLLQMVPNITAGTRYLDWIANRFFRMNVDLSDISRVPEATLRQILAAYNWGIGHVQREVRSGTLDRDAPRETRNYMRQVWDRARAWLGW